jgi:hypothetical protein
MNRFVRGLITEASPLNFPEDASVLEDNFVLNRDGTRNRRLGMDYETSYVKQNSAYQDTELSGLAINTFSWDNVGEDSTVAFVVIQIGNTLYFHAQEQAAISAVVTGSVVIGTTQSVVFSLTSIDGDLVVATGGQEIYVVSYDGSTFTAETFRLRVRDQWGVEDIVDGKDLYEDNNISLRPDAITDEHLYNLRNQSWGVARKVKERGSTPQDAIKETFSQNNYHKYPSNADLIHEWIRPDPEASKQGETFFAIDYQGKPPYNLPAARGYFIIDALNRGTSRVTEYAANMDKHPELVLDLNDVLPEDSTPNGATSVAEYAGRVFYAGFSGSTTNGDENSPQLANYVLFSQLVGKKSDLGRCYQEGDPSSPEASDIVSTDGGLVRVSGAESILGLVAMARGLFVLASNGVWLIQGGSDFGFTADNFEVVKVSERGPVGQKSVVIVDESLMYWGTDGIYHVSRNEVGQWSAESITQNTIQSYYEAIDTTAKNNVTGVFDSFSRKVRWMYPTSTLVNGQPVTKELVLDTIIGAFYPSTVNNLGGANVPIVVDYIETFEFNNTSVSNFIQEAANGVQVNGDDVVISESLTETGNGSIKYLTLIPVPASTIQYTVSEYHNQAFLDWATEDGSGVDAHAFIYTGEVIAGDSSRDKMIPYLTFHMGYREGEWNASNMPTITSGLEVVYVPTRSWNTNGPSNPYACGHGNSGLLSTASDGRIFCWLEGHYSSQPGNVRDIKYAYSSDFGETWTEYDPKLTFPIYPGWPYTSNVGYISMTVIVDPNSSRLWTHHGTPDHYMSPCYSDDNGASWTRIEESGSTGEVSSRCNGSSLNSAGQMFGAGRSFGGANANDDYGYRWKDAGGDNWNQDDKIRFGNTDTIISNGYNSIEIGGREFVGGSLSQLLEIESYGPDTFTNHGFFPHTSKWSTNDDDQILTASPSRTDVTTVEYYRADISGGIGTATITKHVVQTSFTITTEGSAVIGAANGYYILLVNEYGSSNGTTQVAAFFSIDGINWSAEERITLPTNHTGGPSENRPIHLSYGGAAGWYLTYLGTDNYHRLCRFKVSENNVPVGGSGTGASCLVRSQWDFSNSINSGRWSRQFQAYRSVRQVEKGFDVVTTRNKLRGRGAAVSLYLETEPGKSCDILGWNMALIGHSHV